MAKPKKKKPQATKTKAKTKPTPKAKAKPAAKLKAKAPTKPKVKAKAKPATKVATKVPKAKSAPAAAPKTAVDKAAFLPGVLVEHEGGKYSVVYTSFPALDPEAEARGIQGGGYTWHGLVVHLMKEQAPSHLDRVAFDPEASMFCAYGNDLEALGSVAKALAHLEDEELRKKLLATVDVRDYD